MQKEHIYHPSVYKTQFCESTLTANGDCTGFGKHCSKAHGEVDLRQPLYDDSAEAANSGPLPLTSPSFPVKPDPTSSTGASDADPHGVCVFPSARLML